MRIAVCSGSFDPITLGHLDIIRRTAACFDLVYVCVSANAEKSNPMFTSEQKLRLVEMAVEGLENVKAELLTGLLADYVVSKGSNVIVRGARNATDYDVEAQLAMINRDIHPGLETLVLPASPEYQYFSSTMVREMIRYHQPLEKYLPEAIIPEVLRITESKGE